MIQNTAVRSAKCPRCFAVVIENQPSTCVDSQGCRRHAVRKVHSPRTRRKERRVLIFECAEPRVLRQSRGSEISDEAGPGGGVSEPMEITPGMDGLQSLVSSSTGHQRDSTRDGSRMGAAS